MTSMAGLLLLGSLAGGGSGVDEVDPFVREMGISSLRDPGPMFFFSAINEAGIVLAVVLLVALRRLRRGRGVGPSRGVATGALVAAVLLWAAGIGCYLVSAGERGLAEVGYVLLWEASLVALMVAVVWCAPRRLGGRGEALAAALVIAITLATRLVWVGGIPARAHSEEIWAGLWSRYCLEGRTPELFGSGFYETPIMYMCLDAVAMQAFGDDLFGVRMSKVILSTLAVLFTWLLARELFPGRLAAPAAALFTAFQHVFLHYSRTGLGYVDGPFATAIVAYLTVRAIRGGGWPWAIAAGAASGVFCQGYFSTRVAPAVALGVMALAIAAGGQRRARTIGIAAIVLGFIIAAGPIGAYYLSRPGSLSSRERDVLAFTPAQLVRGNAAAWATLGRNAIVTATRHTIGYDTDSHYGARVPYVEPLLLPLLLVGAVGACRREHRLAAAVIAVWIGTTLGLGALPMKEPLLRRTLGLVPAYGLLVGLGCSELERLGSRWRRPATVVAALLLAVACIDQLDLALRRYPTERPEDLQTATGRYLASHDSQPIQLLTMPELMLDDAHLSFMAPRTAARDLLRLGDLEAGTVIASATHAPLLAALASEPGARIERVWGDSPEWHLGDRLASTMEARRAPPVMLHLPSVPPSAAAVVTLVSETGSNVDSFAAPVAMFDYRRAIHRGVGEVVITQRIVTEAAARLSARVRRRRATVALTVDGRRMVEGKGVELAAGPHLLIATIVPGAPLDSYQVVPLVEARSRAGGGGLDEPR